MPLSPYLSVLVNLSLTSGTGVSEPSLSPGWTFVTITSRYARRFCALGAIKRAGCDLGLPVENASRALEWQTVRPVIDWHDDKLRTHAEVVAAFDAAIDALAVMTPAA